MLEFVPTIFRSKVRILSYLLASHHQSVKTSVCFSCLHILRRTVPSIERCLYIHLCLLFTHVLLLITPHYVILSLVQISTLVYVNYEHDVFISARFCSQMVNDFLPHCPCFVLLDIIYAIMSFYILKFPEMCNLKECSIDSQPNELVSLKCRELRA